VTPADVVFVIGVVIFSLIALGGDRLLAA